MELRQLGRVARYLLDALSAAPSREARERSAVSRFYFEAHHEGRRWVEQRGYPIPRRATHQFVADRIGDHDPVIARMLDSLFQLRNRAEYELEEPWQSEAVEDAERAVDAIRAALTALGT